MRKYVGFISTDLGMIIEGVHAQDFDDADSHFEDSAEAYAGGHLMWVEEYTPDLQGEFDAVTNLFGDS